MDLQSKPATVVLWALRKPESTMPFRFLRRSISPVYIAPRCPASSMKFSIAPASRSNARSRPKTKNSLVDDSKNYAKRFADSTPKRAPRTTPRFGRAEYLLQRRHRGSAKLRKQPDGGLLDKRVFGVGVGHESLVGVHRWPIAGEPLIQPISSRNAPACLSEKRNPTELTLAGFSGGTSV